MLSLNKTIYIGPRIQLKYNLDFFFRKYETFAGDILSECSELFEMDTVENLLLRKQSNWGNTTCIGIAEAAICRYFLAHESVELLTNAIWFQGLPVSNLHVFGIQIHIM